MKLIPVLVLLGVFEIGNAETVSLKEAKEKSSLFFDKLYGEKTAPSKYVYNGKNLTTNRLFTPFYVFNNPRGGFVIISAENKAFPILGFSLNGSFNPDKLSSEEKGWLESYAKDIELIRYDSRVPLEAEEAWVNFGDHVEKLFNAHSVDVDITTSIEQDRDALSSILTSDNDTENGNFSILYTPRDWKDMIDLELKNHKSIPMGYVNWNKDLVSANVYGKKGDYYQMRFDKKNDWWLRMTATEHLSDRFIANFNPVPEIKDDIEEESPFEFIEYIMADHASSETAIREKENTPEIVEAQIKGLGGGHFEIMLPENAKLAMLYSLTGQHIGRRTYKDSPVAFIDIEAQPTGFYFVILYGESGKPYGFKLYR